MRLAGLRALRGYKAPKGYYSGAVRPAAPNLLDRQINGGSAISPISLNMRGFFSWRL
jgi:hypothetical protein